MAPKISIVRRIKERRGAANDSREDVLLQNALQQEALQHKTNAAYFPGSNVVLIASGTLYLQQKVNQKLVFSGQIALFLFADSIIICAEYPPGVFAFRERFSLQDTELLGSDGSHGKHDFQVVGFDRQYIFMCNGKKDKDEWMDAFATRSNPM